MTKIILGSNVFVIYYMFYFNNVKLSDSLNFNLVQLEQCIKI